LIAIKAKADNLSSPTVECQSINQFPFNVLLYTLPKEDFDFDFNAIHFTVVSFRVASSVLLASPSYWNTATRDISTSEI